MPNVRMKRANDDHDYDKDMIGLAAVGRPKRKLEGWCGLAGDGDVRPGVLPLPPAMAHVKRSRARRGAYRPAWSLTATTTSLGTVGTTSRRSAPRLGACANVMRWTPIAGDEECRSRSPGYQPATLRRVGRPLLSLTGPSRMSLRTDEHPNHGMQRTPLARRR
jgi:hypothetical protein